MHASSSPYNESIKLARSKAGPFDDSIPNSPAMPNTESVAAVMGVQNRIPGPPGFPDT